MAMKTVIGVLITIGWLSIAQAQAMTPQTIKMQVSDQKDCVESRLAECVRKCQSLDNASLHCHGLCQLNIANECRDAGE